MKFSIRKWQAGYTLIEVLVVMTVVGVLGSMLVVIFINALRGSNKSNSEAAIRQNGNYALSQISNTVRYAKSVSSPVCVATEPAESSTLSIISVDDKTITYTCPALETDTLTINDGTDIYPIFDKLVVSVTSCSFTCIKQSSVSPPVIGIKFNLKKTGGNLTETSANSLFSTTIAIRNYNQ